MAALMMRSTNLVVECVEDVTESEAITENNMIKDDLTEQEVKAKNHECEEETTGSDTITKENITVEKDLTEVEVVLKKTSDECVECITGSDTRTSENNIMENEPIDEKVELKKAADECVTVSDAITRENNITENYPTDEGAELKKHADECVSVSDAITTENNIMENDTTDEGAELKKHADECVSVSDAITTENNIVENDTTDEEVKLKKHSNECGEFVTGSAITENNVVKDENTVGCNIVEDDITDEAEFNLSNINIEHTQCFTKDTDFSEKHLMTENMTVKDGGEVCTVIANKIDNEMTQHQSIDESIHTSVNCDNYRVEEKMMEGDISIDAGICMSTGSSPIPPSSPVSTGNQALDTTFTQHLLHCQYLLSMLGSYGPLKAKETMALTKIEKQTRIFQRLLQINPTDTIASVEQVVPELNEKPAFIEFWLRCCEEPTILYGGVDSIMVQLELKFGAKLRTTHPTIADNVFQSLIKQMLDRQAIDINSSNSLVTLYQFTNWCLAKNRPDIEHYVNDLISELTLNETLKHGNEDMLSVIRQLPKTPLPASNLYALAMLLLNADSTTKAATSIYMEMMATDNNWKRQALNVYLEYLEENDKVLRQAGCLALASMNATSCIDHLLYICRCDVDDVKQCARDALLSFGEEGKKAYESTISSQYDVQSMALLPNITSMHHQMTTEL
uniref:Protein FAM65B-like n=1 Tax=Saccoglossus kowalevskii TaxID=10224 RepID=A0ABM0MX72_SACKO|nr:PREDICTED: protein FAM65B-like [Saccoglossus kowalevskii]